VSKTTAIEWTHHTFNPWWGCTKISPACAHCYAERDSKRWGKELWGDDAPRKIASEATWRGPIRWNDDAIAAGVRRRVFCASMADVFELRADLDAPRERLWKLIEKTKQLDWLLLTKRPESVLAMVPSDWLAGFPSNVWVGTTVENQARADELIPHLLKIPARIRFLSCEPLLEHIELEGLDHFRLRELDWVICGGESGPKARPMSPEWARSIRGQCQSAGVPFFFKQWGEWEPIVACYPGEDEVDEDGCEIDVPVKVSEFDGFDKIALEPTGYVAHREFADGSFRCDYQPSAGSWWMARTGKKRAGKKLDGVEWLEVPE
jgi:protein gp37